MTNQLKHYTLLWGYTIIRRVAPSSLGVQYTLLKNVESRGLRISLYQRKDGTLLIEERSQGILHPSLYEVKEILQDVYEVTEDDFNRWLQTRQEAFEVGINPTPPPVI